MSHYLEMKILHALVVPHIKNVVIKRFGAHEAEIGLTAISLFESAR